MGGGGGGGESGDFGFQIAPMVDVVFVLLLFFMALAGQKITEGLLTINLPSTAKGDPGTKVPIVVDIMEGGDVIVNGQNFGKAMDPKQREIPRLLKFLQDAVASSPEDPIIIRPTSTTQHERVVDVLNACRIAKVKNLSFG